MFRTATHTVRSDPPRYRCTRAQACRNSGSQKCTFKLLPSTHLCSDPQRDALRCLHVHSFPQSVSVCTQMHLYSDHEVTCAHSREALCAQIQGSMSLHTFVLTYRPAPLPRWPGESLRGSPQLRLTAHSYMYTHVLRETHACSEPSRHAYTCQVPQ